MILRVLLALSVVAYFLLLNNVRKHRLDMPVSRAVKEEIDIGGRIGENP